MEICSQTHLLDTCIHVDILWCKSAASSSHVNSFLLASRVRSVEVVKVTVQVDALPKGVINIEYR